MPKKILHESAIHHLLMAARRYIQKSTSLPNSSSEASSSLQRLVTSFEFDRSVSGKLRVRWTYPVPGETDITLGDATLYYRGDNSAAVQRQSEAGQIFSDDRVKQENDLFFDQAFGSIAKTAGLVT